MARYEKEEPDLFLLRRGGHLPQERLLEKTGLFDEEHFAYLEDTDIWLPGAGSPGMRTGICPGRRVYHVGSGTTGSRYNQFKIRYSSRNYMSI